jgi:phosphatidate phosphatase APP1
MPVWFRKFSRFLSKSAVKVDYLRYHVKRKFGWLGTPVILPYLSFGNSHGFVLRGRVMEDQGLANPDQLDSIWQNFSAMVKRHSYSEIPEVSLSVKFNGVEKIITTDDQGYFRVVFELNETLSSLKEWHEVDLKLLDKVVKDQPEVVARGKVLISQQKSQFGIISDVDDTILISHSPHLMKKLKLMVSKNAHTRLPFEGVAAFYRALQSGGSGKFYNPIFYVSSSSWLLYDLLLDFCKVRNIPLGPFLLRNSRLDQYKFITSMHRGHKLEKIEQVLSTFSDMKFILLGDSGQKDPEIYKTVVQDFPNRIEKIYIRDVSGERRHKEILKYVDELKDKGVEMVLVQDTISAAIHAASCGYIQASCLNDIVENKYYDSTAPEGIFDGMNF